MTMGRGVIGRSRSTIGHAFLSGPRAAGDGGRDMDGTTASRLTGSEIEVREQAPAAWRRLLHGSLRSAAVCIVICLSVRVAAAATAPIIDNVVPNHGPATRSINVTLNGNSMSEGIRIFFGGPSGAEATNVVRESRWVVTCDTPPGTGTVDVYGLELDGLNGTLVNGYTFDPPPSLSAVSPAGGPPGGGTSVTISGDHFVTGATATFGASTVATTWVSANQLTCTSPSGTLGTTVDVTVTNPDLQTGTAVAAFKYALAPSSVAVSPAGGPPPG